MAQTYPELISDGRGNLVAASSITHLVAGTMVSRDLDTMTKLYEDFLGLEAVRIAPDRMLLRDRRAKYLMENGERDFFVIEVHQVTDVEKPQKMLNHWGISVGTREEVDRLYTLAKAQKADWLIKKMRPITGIHESYGFFIIDEDDNWWEIENRGSMSNDLLFAKGDYDNRVTDPSRMIDPSLPIASTRSLVLGDEAFMTHGTVDVADIVKARGFYEEVLGLRSVLRSDMAQFTSGGGDFSFVGVQVGERHVADQSADNRWILLVADEAQLADRHARAIALSGKFDIRQVCEPVRHDDGSLSFLIESADSNWFEFSTRLRSYYSAPFKVLSEA